MTLLFVLDFCPLTFPTNFEGQLAFGFDQLPILRQALNIKLAIVFEMVMYLISRERAILSF